MRRVSMLLCSFQRAEQRKHHNRMIRTAMRRYDILSKVIRVFLAYPTGYPIEYCLFR